MKNGAHTLQAFNEKDSVSLNQWMRTYASRWYLFLIGISVASILAILFIKTASPSYRYRATMLLRNESAETLLINKILERLGEPVRNPELADEMGVLSSRKLILMTLQKLDWRTGYYSYGSFARRELFRETPFLVEWDSTHPQLTGLEFEAVIIRGNQIRILASGENVSVINQQDGKIEELLPIYKIDTVLQAGIEYVDSYSKFRVNLRPQAEAFIGEKLAFVHHDLESQAMYYQQSLKVLPLIDDSHMVEIISEGSPPEKQRIFLNTLMEVYLQKEQERIMAAGKKALVFLDSQLTKVSDSLLMAEGANQWAKGQTGVVDLGISTRNMSYQLSRLQEEALELKTQYENYQLIGNSLKEENKLNTDISPSVAGIYDEQLNRLLGSWQELMLEKTDLEVRVRSGHPDLDRINQQLENTRQLILKNVDNGMQQTQRAMENKEALIASVEKKMAQMPRTERLLQRKGRELDFTSARYKGLQQSRIEMEIALETNSVQKEIIDRATMVGQGPITPRKGMIFTLAMLLGLGLPWLLIHVIDFLDARISGKKDLERYTSIPVLGVVEQYSGQKKVYLHGPKAQFTVLESFRNLRVQLLYDDEIPEKQVIGITSSLAGEGKTFCATHLASVFATASKKTLLIDADLRRPQVPESFGFSQEEGLADYLRGEIQDWKSLIHTDLRTGLDILPSGKLQESPLDLLCNPLMEQLMNKLRAEYAHILLDSPPLGLVSDYLILMHLTDYNIYVVRDKKTEISSLRGINELYNTQKIHNLRLLINDVKSVRAYGYADRAHYYAST